MKRQTDTQTSYWFEAPTYPVFDDIFSKIYKCAWLIVWGRWLLGNVYRVVFVHV